jgi:hypothetical protein
MSSIDAPFLTMHPEAVGSGRNATSPRPFPAQAHGAHWPASALAALRMAHYNYLKIRQNPADYCTKHLVKS